MTEMLKDTRNVVTDIAVAESFLEARNLEAAKRIAAARLSVDPKDRDALTLLVKIAESTPDHKLGLALVRQALAYYPADWELRFIEVTTLMHLRRKRDAKKAVALFHRDFPRDITERTSLDTIYAQVFGKVPDINRIFDGLPLDDLDLPYALTLRSAGGYLEAAPHFAVAKSKGDSGFAFNWAYAYNNLMLCRFGAARRYARQALAEKARRFEKRVILCSYLFCVPTILWAHLVYVAWRMARGYFPTAAVCGVFLLFAPLFYAPLMWFAQGWGALGLPFGATIAVGSVVIHSLAMLTFEPRIAMRLADPGKSVELSGY